MHDYRIEQARITDLKHPYERQPREFSDIIPLYDGFVLQRIFAETIPSEELDHVHIIFTSLLECTFSEADWRYHARAVVCGTPSIISIPGIIEAPAKPREFYIFQLGSMSDFSLKKRFGSGFMHYGDDRMTGAAIVYTMQALFFFVADGDPFCANKSCSLYNAHWQTELIDIVEKGSLCDRHAKMANKFNNR